MAAVVGPVRSVGLLSWWPAVSPFTVVRSRRDWVVDGLLFALALGFFALTAATQGRSWQALPAWVVGLDLALGVVAAVALWWRRRFPVRLAAVMAVVGGLVLTAGFPALVSIYTVAALHRFRVALALTGAHLVIGVLYYLVFPTPFGGAGLGLWAVVLVLLYVVALTLGLASRSRRQVIAGLLAAAEQDRRAYEERLGQVRRAERAQIAREMHDVLAHRISILSVHAGALEYRTGAGGPRLTDAELREAVGVIRGAAHRALEELHEVLAVLGPVASEVGPAADELGTGPPAPTLADLQGLVAEARAAGQRVDLRVDVPPEERHALRPKAQRTVYRVVQEGLTNARKHAPGSRVEVTVAASGSGSLRVRVANVLPVGTTRTEIPGAGVGLIGLTERVEVEGGRLRAEVEDGHFVLHADIPGRR